jgi:hypothetical protein
MYTPAAPPRIPTPLERPKSIGATTPTIGQQLQDAANGLAAAHRSVFTPQYGTKQGSLDMNDEMDDDDEGDRLQALAAQVYRSASAQQSRA